MKVAQKKLYFNKYIWITAVMVFIVSVGSFLAFSNFMANIHLGLEISIQNASFDFYPMHGYSLMQIIAPVFASVSMLSFMEIKQDFIFISPRCRSYQNYILKKIFQYILVACLAMYAAYLLFLFLGAAILPIHYKVDRYLFIEWTGKEFSNEHPILYYMLEGFLRYVIFMAAYALFAIAVSFLTQKKYLCILIPLLYFDLGAIGEAALERLIQVITGAQLRPNLMFLAPTYTVMSNSREYISGFAILFPLLPVLIFSLGVIIYRLYFDKRNDVYAAH